MQKSSFFQLLVHAPTVDVPVGLINLLVLYFLN